MTAPTSRAIRFTVRGIPVAERFAIYTPPAEGNACCLWAGGVGRSGYGLFWIKGKTVPAHRIAWELANGPIPDGMFVCHHCDVKRCVRLDHLFLGTPKENTADMWAKGRNSSFVPPPPRGDEWHAIHDPIVARGEQVGTSKLTALDIMEIRARCAAGESRNSVRADYGIKRSTIHGIVRRHSWKHIP